MQLQNVNVNKVYRIESTKFGLGLEKLSKTVLIHVKSNKKVYMQIGKIAIYGVATATGLMITNIQAFASTTWADDINTRAEYAYNGLVVLCSWLIIAKAVWDMAVACIHGEMRKAPSIGMSYVIVVGVLYAMPMVLNAIKGLMVG